MVKVRSPHNSEAISGTLDGITFRDYGGRKSAQMPRRNVKRAMSPRRRAQIGFFTDAASLFRVMCEMRAEYFFERRGRENRSEQTITPKELFNGMKGEAGGIYQYWQSVASTWNYVSLRTYNADWEASEAQEQAIFTAIAGDTFTHGRTWAPTQAPPPTADGAIILLIDQLIQRDFRRNTDAFMDRFGDYELRRIGG